MIEIKFSKNQMNIYKAGVLIQTSVIPPQSYGCDLIGFGEKTSGFYQFNFQGLIVITTPLRRKVYHQGNIIYYKKR